MGKTKTFETTNKVVYRDEEFDVSGEVYVEIEDKLEAIEGVVGLSEGEKDNAREWITYKELINTGHFVSKPEFPEPQLSKTFSQPETTLEDIPFYEPDRIWTKEKILAERERLIRREEAFLKKQKLAVAREVAKLPRKDNTRQFYHPDGTPYSTTDYAGSFLTLFIIFGVLFLLVFWCGTGVGK